jgi:hypothetical protein
MLADGMNRILQDTFNAFVVTKTDDHQFSAGVVEQVLDNLPQGDVLMRVHYYKAKVPPWAGELRNWSRFVKPGMMRVPLRE